MSRQLAWPSSVLQGPLGSSLGCEVAGPCKAQWAQLHPDSCVGSREGPSKDWVLRWPLEGKFLVSAGSGRRNALLGLTDTHELVCADLNMWTARPQSPLVLQVPCPCPFPLLTIGALGCGESVGFPAHLSWRPEHSTKPQSPWSTKHACRYSSARSAGALGKEIPTHWRVWGPGQGSP